MSKQPIKIELIHDVVCSWCPIGYSNIKQALAEYEDRFDIDFRFLPYELNPGMPDEGERIDDHLKRRNGWDTDQFLRYREDLVKRAEQAGLVYDFAKRTHYWNTAKAHKLIHIAEKSGRQEAVNQILIRRYFTEGMIVSDEDQLTDVASEAGLVSSEVLDALRSSKVDAEMRKKYAKVASVQVRSVPTFIFNDRDVVPGSNSVEFFSKYFAAILNESASRVASNE